MPLRKDLFYCIDYGFYYNLIFLFFTINFCSKQRYCSKATEPVASYPSNNKDGNHRKCLTKNAEKK